MSGDFFLDWLTLAVSLYNTIVVLWLGLTVLLNAERRHLGIWLAGGGLLTAAVFFLSHTAILGFGFWGNPAIDFWWRIGWVPVILSPLIWYVVMLWYAGFWNGRRNPIYRRHAIPMGLLLLTALGFAALFVFSNPLPSYQQIIRYDLSASPAIAGAPVLLWLYPPYMLACIGLSLDALLRPGPTERMMGPAARQRARPWLAAAGGMLLVVSLLVSGILLWAVSQPTSSRGAELVAVHDVAIADLLISLLIGVSVTLSGQAIVAYEVFTGKSLPRGGLQRYWRRAIILAGGFGAATALGITIQLPAIYSLLISACLLVVFYALLSWRSYAERERFISELRPFVAGPQSYTALLGPQPIEAGEGVQRPFTALCEQVLGARWAALTPAGAAAELFGPSLAYPPGESAFGRVFGEPPEPYSPATLCLPVTAGEDGEPAWAVPLWNEGGLCGVLLLGEKNGGVYTQEEIEIARVVCERLVDLQAGAEVARRLLALQRRQLAESQVLDRRTRRALHDEVLPQLHEALLAISAASNDAAGREESMALLTGVHRQIADLLHDSPKATTPETARSGPVAALKQVVGEEMKGVFDRVRWQVEPPAEARSQALAPFAAETLFYAAREVVRNAARHAQPPSGGLCLTIEARWVDGLEICIQDNGVGTNTGLGARLNSGEDGGSGQGLVLHRTLLAVVGGSLEIEAADAGAMRVRLWVPG